MAKVKDLLVNGSSRFIGKIYASDQFISQVANGTAPFVVSSSTLVANLNADMTDGLHVHTGRNNEVNKIVRTDGSGYIQTGYINTNVGTENLAISRIFYEYNNDGYIRKMAPSSFFSVLENSGNNISITVAGQNRKLTVGYASNANNADILNIKSINSETDIEQSGIRGYSGSGSSWTGSISSMAYAAIFSFGSPLRGWQLWAGRTGEVGNGLCWRRGIQAATSWDSERLILDSGNYTDYTVKKDGTGASGTWGISITGNADKLDNIDSTGFYRFSHISKLQNKDLNYANNQYGTWNYGDDNTQKNTPTTTYGCYLSWGDLASSDTSTTRNQTAQIGINCWNDLGRMYVRARQAGNRDVTSIGSWRTVAFISDIPTSLPANGGNADTVDNKHASDFATAGHTHSLGNKPASDLSSTYPRGISVGGIYANGYPFQYGSTITASGNGGYFQIAGQWNSNVTGASNYDFPTEMYIRGRRDSYDVWTTWTRVLTDRNYTSYLGYIGTTAVQASSAAQALSGITSINSRLSINAESDNTRLGFGGVHGVTFGEPGYAHRIYYFRPAYGSNGVTYTSLIIQNASAAASPTFTTTHSFDFNGNAYHSGNIYLDTGDSDRFIQFRYNSNNYAGASWRLLSRGSGSGDTNYFDIETGGSNASNNTWYRVIRLTMDNRYVGIGTDLPTYKLHIAGDSYTTGWSRAANGFYVEGTGVHFTHHGSVGEIDITSTNEFLWGSSSATLYFNYRAVSRGTTVNNYIWNAGSSTSWASHNMGNIWLNGSGVSLRLGPQNSSHAHYETTASVSHWFNKRVDVNGDIWRYGTNYGIASDG